MHTRGRKIKVFSCNANQDLARAICGELGLPLGDSVVKTFSDCASVNINESVRGVDVYVVQSFSLPKVNDYLMELLIMIDALKEHQQVGLQL